MTKLAWRSRGKARRGRVPRVRARRLPAHRSVGGAAVHRVGRRVVRVLRGGRRVEPEPDAAVDPSLHGLRRRRRRAAASGRVVRAGIRRRRGQRDRFRGLRAVAGAGPRGGVARLARPDPGPCGRYAVWRAPQAMRARWLLDLAANSRALHRLLAMLPTPVMLSDIEDVVYVSYLVRADRLAGLVPEGLEAPDARDGRGMDDGDVPDVPPPVVRSEVGGSPATAVPVPGAEQLATLRDRSAHRPPRHLVSDQRRDDTPARARRPADVRGADAPACARRA